MPLGTKRVQIYIYIFCKGLQENTQNVGDYHATEKKQAKDKW